MKKIGSYKLADAIAPRAIASSTNATPIAVTTGAAHGYSTGDKVTIFGHATNTAANGTWIIIKTGATTFTLTDSVGNGIGGATGVHAIAAKRILVSDADHVKLTFDTDGGGDAAFTVKVAGAIDNTGVGSIPDFAGTKGPANRYDYIDIIDDEDGSSVDGDTGFVVASADDNRSFTVNTDALDWLTVVPTAGTAGELSVFAGLYSIN